MDVVIRQKVLLRFVANNGMRIFDREPVFLVRGHSVALPLKVAFLDDLPSGNGVLGHQGVVVVPE